MLRFLFVSLFVLASLVHCTQGMEGNPFDRLSHALSLAQSAVDSGAYIGSSPTERRSLVGIHFRSAAVVLDLRWKHKHTHKQIRRKREGESHPTEDIDEREERKEQQQTHIDTDYTHTDTHTAKKEGEREYNIDQGTSNSTESEASNLSELISADNHTHTHTNSMTTAPTATLTDTLTDTHTAAHTDSHTETDDHTTPQHKPLTRAAFSTSFSPAVTVVWPHKIAPPYAYSSAHHTTHPHYTYSTTESTVFLCGLHTHTLPLFSLCVQWDAHRQRVSQRALTGVQFALRFADYFHSLSLRLGQRVTQIPSVNALIVSHPQRYTQRLKRRLTHQREQQTNNNTHTSVEEEEKTGERKEKEEDTIIPNEPHTVDGGENNFNNNMNTHSGDSSNSTNITNTTNSARTIGASNTNNASTVSKESDTLSNSSSQATIPLQSTHNNTQSTNTTSAERKSAVDEEEEEEEEEGLALYWADVTGTFCHVLSQGLGFRSREVNDWLNSRGRAIAKALLRGESKGGGREDQPNETERDVECALALARQCLVDCFSSDESLSHLFGNNTNTSTHFAGEVQATSTLAMEVHVWPRP